MNIAIYDKSELSFSEPKVFFSNCFIDMQLTEVLNGEQTLSFSVPYIEGNNNVTTEDFVQFDYENRNYKFVVRDVSIVRDDQGKYMKVECEGLYSILIDKIVTLSDGVETELLGATAKEALERAVKGTKFKIGTVDEGFGTWDIEMGDKNVLEILREIQDKWIGIDFIGAEKEGLLPPEVSNLTATSEGTNVRLKFEVPDDEDIKRLIIYRGIAKWDEITEDINYGGTMEYIDENLDPGTVYYYRIYTSYLLEDEDDEEEGDIDA